ncbi:MAG: pyridoxamine 5'-phosphate oxidase family protein [Bauldia sp.]
MAEAYPADRAWELIDKVQICSLVTVSGGAIHSRPMSSMPRQDEHAIYFLTSANSQKSAEIGESEDVELIYADPHAQKYVSVAGQARIANDRVKIRELWTPFAKAWWDGPDDPDIRLLTVRPVRGQYWDSPGTIASSIAMLAAAVTGTRPAGQESKETAL